VPPNPLPFAVVVELGEAAMERRSRPRTRRERAAAGADELFDLIGSLVIHLAAALIVMVGAGLVTGLLWEHVPGGWFSALGVFRSLFWPSDPTPWSG
jgi:hypothetical protein